MHQPDVNTLYICFAQSRRTKVAGQELKQAEVRRYEVIDLLLAFRERLFVSCGKLLFSVEGICMPV